MASPEANSISFEPVHEKVHGFARFCMMFIILALHPALSVIFETATFEVDPINRAICHLSQVGEGR